MMYNTDEYRSQYRKGEEDELKAMPEDERPYNPRTYRKSFFFKFFQKIKSPIVDEDNNIQGFEEKSAKSVST